MTLGYLPVQSSPVRVKSCAPLVDPRGHTIAVQLYLVHPLWPRGWLLDQLGELRRDELRERDASTRGADLDDLGG
jgi:hypothetical protein